MSIDSQAQNATPSHPSEGECINIALVAGAPTAIDLTAIAQKGNKIGIYTHTPAGTQFLGYKFSSNPVASISVASGLGLGNATACGMMGGQSYREAFIPKGKPYLHLLAGPVAMSVYIHKCSQTRN